VTPVSAPLSGPVATSAIAVPAGSSNEDLRKAAQAFEAIFLRQLLSSARAADFGGEDLIGGPGIEQFEAMRDEHFADIASQQGVFGLAAAIERQVAAALPQATAVPAGG
jgi:peptidoglycan hydrolase FlgJ